MVTYPNKIKNVTHGTRMRYNLKKYISHDGSSAFFLLNLILIEDIYENVFCIWIKTPVLFWITWIMYIYNMFNTRTGLSSNV